MKRVMAGFDKMPGRVLNHCRKSLLQEKKNQKSLLSNASGSNESLFQKKILPPHLQCPGLCLSCTGSSWRMVQPK